MNFRVSWFLSALLGAIALSPQPLLAQPITSGGDGTIVTPAGQTYNITGGTQSSDNANLFHTFQDFGLEIGETAQFIADPNIMNILGRVVGGNTSVINGLIEISGGNANLFLLNPAGIIFGPGAFLNVPGDFTATTATGIGFGGDRWFNAFGNNDYLNLTGIPLEFAFDLENPRGIINLADLTVNGGDLTLLAGTIASEGELAASNGNLAIASVPGSSLIRISQVGSLLSLEIEPPRNADGTITEITRLNLPELLTGDGLDTLLNQAGSDPNLVVSGNVWGTNGEGRDILAYAAGDLTLNGSWSTATDWGDAGNIALEARGNIFTGDLDASSFELEEDSGRGGDISLWAGESIFVNGEIDTRSLADFGISQDGGNVSVEADNGFIAVVDRIMTSSSDADAGAIALSANSTIYTDNLTARSLGYGNGGAIDISSNVGAVFTGDINAASENGWGGNVAIAAEETISTGDIITRSSAGEQGGEIFLFSRRGSIDTGFLNASASQGNGGDISLRAMGNISISYLKTEGFYFGGMAHISTDSYFRATDYFLAQNGLFASLSTAGNLEGGAISIYHGGNFFAVGNAWINGTAEAITTGQYSLLPYQLFDSEFQQGNILISNHDPFIDTDFPEDEDINFEAREFVDNLSEKFDFVGEHSGIQQEELAGELEDNLEEHFTEEFTNYLGLDDVANVTPEQAQQKLRDIEQLTGIKPALVYAIFTSDESSDNRIKNELKSTTKAEEKPLWQYPQTNANHQNFLPKNQNRRATDRLELIVVSSEGGVIRKTLPVTREQVLKSVRDYRRSITNLRRPGAYLESARDLYQFLLAPLDSYLQAQGINNLSFIMDAGLRSIPLAALHDGQKFAIEKYSLGMMPSLSLTDTRYSDIRSQKILAMGAETFVNQSSLPAVPVELEMITESLWQGKAYLNEEFTLDNFHAAREDGDYNIVHLATHGEFKSGAPSNSYIQFWDSKLQLDRLRELKLNNPQVNLLVLSACRTAVGDEQAELGFSGLAVMAGVKSTLGSLWYVNDEGTLAFMSQFYDRLQTHSTKAEALRQAQLAMLKGQIRVQDGQLITPLGAVALPPELEGIGDRNLAHPYYWSAFTLIGNPW